MAKKEYGTRKKYHFIYKTTNLLSGRYYIGMHSTDNLEDQYLGSGTYLKRSINKHGKENHSIEILEFVNSREELVAREIEIVSLQEIAKKECMNLKVGGEGGFSREVQRLGNVAAKERKDWLRENDEEWRAKVKLNMSKGMVRYYANSPKREGPFAGKSHSSATIQKMKEVKKGYGKGEENSQYGTCWIMKDGVNIRIKKDELNSFLSQGWSKGRKLK